ncbi:MAG: diguanylate cyclase [Methyloprofundus sp.]|nr:diguanylate cyclase [Methyloprofundus sp.]
MNFNIKNNQQIFNWAIALTQAQNYQDLTIDFLEVLKELPEVENVEAFEVHGGRQRRASEFNQFTEQLVRRFPLDFTSTQAENDIGWLDDFEQAVAVKVVQVNSVESEYLIPIKGSVGPERAIIIHGTLSEETLFVISNLLKIYQNQVILHDAKERDVLTQLLNRQSFETRLVQVCEYFQQHDVPEKHSWIAMLDIDHFKRVNDDFGHLYGDEVLLIFSQLMEKRFRYNDFLFRFGGEEFVVILNLAERSDAEIAFNAFRELIAGHDFPTVGKVTVSIGVEQIGAKGMPTTLLDRADQGLYHAKENGRNKVVFYSEIASELENTEVFDDIELF